MQKNKEVWDYSVNNYLSYGYDAPTDPRTGKPYTKVPNPGEIGGIPCDLSFYCGSSAEGLTALIAAMTGDLAYMGRTLTQVDDIYIPNDGYLIALFINTNAKVYHVIRSNGDGTWSQKAGPNGYVNDRDSYAPQNTSSYAALTDSVVRNAASDYTSSTMTKSQELNMFGGYFLITNK